MSTNLTGMNQDSCPDPEEPQLERKKKQNDRPSVLR
jgi:hypothetical protein